ncbi:formiminoglutamase [Evansella vedderi]|uniref:Formiminoglutamase n=1 Tax=Evansella vedderi TaxID=38282 RepID=A0ABT9ZSG6_9BACI|nr:N-formylglutamate amidohydrolase [Evansella vedderi]MDQ0254175.1 formiminoglutamase [Evansella vedderi]
MINGRKLPIVISIPHGGISIPPGLRTICLLSKQEILLDSDTWTRELYNFKNSVEEYVDTDIARIVVDMNRSRNDLPPFNPDGVVKTHSVVGKRVWSTPDGLPLAEVEELLNKYHFTYHKLLEMATNNPNIVLGIDCHSMLAVGPVKGQSGWDKRPLFCISNRGNVNGEFLNKPLTAPPEMMHRLKFLLEKNFKEFVGNNQNTEVPLVSINDPFAGGFITKYHGSKGIIPWIQLEINRNLYLPKEIPSSLRPSEMDLIRLEKIRDILLQVFSDLLFGEKGNKPGNKVS